MLNGTLFISTMCQFFGQALRNHVLEVFITRIDGIKQDLSLYKATADFKHIKLFGPIMGVKIILRQSSLVVWGTRYGETEQKYRSGEATYGPQH